MPTIRILPDRLVSQIAAGEVVERPASVVKELVENALDAGARAIGIDLEGGGARRIRVVDDGAGMDRDDALLAFDRHATSKIADYSDLERVATLGFRGEALASIAAVSKVTLDTAREPGEGTRVRLEGGRVLAAEPAARARGTSVEVASLFWNVPARRKFLKSRETELRRAVEVVEGYALARPETSFTLRHEGRLLLEAPALADAGAGAVRVRVAQLFGPTLATELTEIRDAPAIGGLVGGPETSRGRRTFVFVNRRLVRDRAVLAAFYRAVREEWRSDEFPSLFLFLDLPPESVDVNVHPQKSEVRFRDPRFVDAVGAALRPALAGARREEPAPLREAAGRPLLPAALGWEGLGGRGPQEAPELREGPADGSGAGGWSASAAVGDGAVAAGAARLAVASFAPLERAPVPLSGRSGASRPFRLLGQYKGTLILLEGPDGLYLLDQHVAQERVHYERFRRALEQERTPQQRLLAPSLLELSRAEAMRLAELAPALAEAGFEVVELSGGAIGVAATPAAVGPDEARALLATLATDAEASPANLRRRLLDDWAAGLACKAAIKMHHPLAPEKLEALISELFRAENPYACPHGRPVVLLLADAELERRFGRR